MWSTRYELRWQRCLGEVEEWGRIEEEVLVFLDLND